MKSFVTRLITSLRALPSQRRAGRRIEKYVPYLILFILTLFYFKNVLFLPQGKIIFGMDIQDQFYYWKSFLVDNLQKGVIPFWNPYSFSGTPFLAHPSVSPFYPLTLIFFIKPIENAFLLYLFIHLLFAAIFSYLCFREKTNHIGGLIGSAVYSFSLLFAARFYSGHIDIISTIIWIPFVYYALTKLYENYSRKYLLLSILALTMQILAGYQFVVIITLELVFLYYIFNSLIKRRNLKVVIIKYFLLLSVVVLSYGISAVQILPTLQFVGLSIRSGGLPYDLAKWGSYSWETFKMFFRPFYYGNPFPENYSYNGPGPNYFELIYFIGVIPLFLIATDFIVAYFLLLKKKKPVSTTFFYYLTIIFFIAIALGGNFPLHRFLYNYTPFYKLFRIPAQHLIIVVFILSLLISKSLLIIKNKFLKLALFVIIVIELFSYNQKFIKSINIPTNNFDQNLINYLKNDKDVARLLMDYPVTSRVRSDIDFEASLFYKLFSTSGYNPIFLKNYYQFIDLLNKSPASSILYYNVEIPPLNPNAGNLDFLNIKYLLIDKLTDSIKESGNSKFEFISEGDYYRLYLNKEYSKRFFLVYNPVYYLSPNEEKDLFLNKNINLKKEVLIKGIQNANDRLNPYCDNKSDSVQILDYQLNSIKLSVNTNCGGWLSSSETYYPGWRAKLDGKPINILLSNKAFRTVFIPSGNHSLEYFYDPFIYKVGLVITLISILMTYILSKSKQLKS